MPHRKNIVGDLGTTKVASDSYDIDNIYFTEEGWVYRHYKRSDKSKWWDEILVAGQAILPAAQGGPADDSGAANSPIEETNPPKLGLAGQKDADGNDVDAPEFETGGDDKNDFEYSVHQVYGAPGTYTTKEVPAAGGGGAPTLDDGPDPNDGGGGSGDDSGDGGDGSENPDPDDNAGNGVQQPIP